MRRSIILIVSIPIFFLLLTNGLYSTTHKDSLYIDPDTISVSEGGKVTFYLDAGRQNAFRLYVIFGGVSGTQPGFPLPGGAVLPINWDCVTEGLLNLINGPWLQDFGGYLDNTGSAEAYLLVPPNSNLPPGGGINFAYALAYPWDFASNPVFLHFVP